VIWIVMENRSCFKVMGSDDAAHIHALAANCGVATNYRAVAHPSLPNYIAMTSGSTHGVTDDANPPSNRVWTATTSGANGSGRGSTRISLTPSTRRSAHSAR
jgi:hypothetical protein